MDVTSNVQDAVLVGACWSHPRRMYTPCNTVDYMIVGFTNPRCDKSLRGRATQQRPDRQCFIHKKEFPYANSRRCVKRKHSCKTIQADDTLLLYPVYLVETVFAQLIWLPWSRSASRAGGGGKDQEALRRTMGPQLARHHRSQFRLFRHARNNVRA